MAFKVTIGVRELAALRAGTVPDSLLTKLDKAELMSGVKRGLSPQDAVEAFKEVLGTRLVAPLGSVWGEIGGRIRRLGLSRMQCVTIAKVAKDQWRPGPIKAESLVRQAEVLLSGAQQAVWGTSTSGNGWQGAAPMEDE